MKRSNKKSHQFPAFQNISDMSATFKRVKAFRAGLNLVRQVVSSLLEGLTNHFIRIGVSQKPKDSS
jgi:hypothetical protein